MFFHPLFAVCFLLLFTVILLNFSNLTKKVVLSSFSLLFYYFVSGSFAALLILISQSLITYALSKKVVDNKKVLWLGVCFLLLPLILFKYKYFWLGQIHKFAENVEIDSLDMIGVVGISFFTFQSLSLLIDCYKKNFSANNLLDVVCHITFFPSVLSGPISSPKDLIPQFENINIKNELYKIGFYRCLSKNIFSKLSWFIC